MAYPAARNPEADSIAKRVGLAVATGAVGAIAYFGAPLLPAHLETAARVTGVIGGLVAAGLLGSIVERGYEVCKRESATFFNRPATISDTFSVVGITALAAGGAAIFGLTAPWICSAAAIAGVTYNCLNLVSGQPAPYRGHAAPNQRNPQTAGRLHAAALAAHGLAAPQQVAPAAGPAGNVPFIDDGNPFNVTFMGTTARFNTVRDAYDTLKNTYINTPLWQQPHVDQRGTQIPFPVHLMRSILISKFNPEFAAGSDTGSFWRLAGIPTQTEQGWQWRAPHDAEDLINGAEVFGDDGVNMSQLLRSVRDSLKPIYERKLLEAILGFQMHKKLEQEQQQQAAANANNNNQQQPGRRARRR